MLTYKYILTPQQQGMFEAFPRSSLESVVSTTIVDKIIIKIDLRITLYCANK